MADTTVIKFCLKCGADVSEKNKLYRIELEPSGAYSAFTVFQKWRHHVDTMPFNALSINGLLYLIPASI